MLKWSASPKRKVMSPNVGLFDPFSSPKEWVQRGYFKFSEKLLHEYGNISAEGADAPNNKEESEARATKGIVTNTVHTY